MFTNEETRNSNDEKEATSKADDGAEKKNAEGLTEKQAKVEKERQEEKKGFPEKDPIKEADKEEYQ